jgi:hypothetical protein
VNLESLVDGRVRPDAGHGQRPKSAAAFGGGDFDPPHRVQRDLVALVPVQDPGPIERGVLADLWDRDVWHVARHDSRTHHSLVTGEQEPGVALVHRDQEVQLAVGRVASDLPDGAAHRRTLRHDEKAGWMGNPDHRVVPTRHRTRSPGRCNGWRRHRRLQLTAPEDSVADGDRERHQGNPGEGEEQRGREPPELSPMAVHAHPGGRGPPLPPTPCRGAERPEKDA